MQAVIGDQLADNTDQRMMEILNHIQIEESIKLNNSLTYRCFNDCVTNFRQKTLDDKEELCMYRSVFVVHMIF